MIVVTVTLRTRLEDCSKGKGIMLQNDLIMKGKILVRSISNRIKKNTHGEVFQYHKHYEVEL